MSAWGTLMDAIVSATETAVTGLDAERDNRLAEDTKTFPHLYVFNPSEVVDDEPHQQEVADIRIRCRLITRGETQEAFYTKRDQIKAAIEADATLAANSVRVLVETSDALEDPRSRDRFCLMVARITQES